MVNDAVKWFYSAALWWEKSLLSTFLFFPTTFCFVFDRYVVVERG